MDIDTKVAREQLRHGVSGTIFCPRSGAVLDVRTAVMITASKPGRKTGCQVLDGKAYDAIAEQLAAAAAEKGATLEIIDGRQLR